MVLRNKIVHLVLFILTIYSTAIAGAMVEKYGFTLTALISMILHPSLLLAGLPFSFWIIIILGSHEMGHYVACRRYGVPSTLPFFIPGPTLFGTFGAVIKIKGVIPDRNALFDIGVAGPVAGFLTSLPALLIGFSQATVAKIPMQEGDMLFGDSLMTYILERIFFPGIGADAVVNVNSVFYAGWVGLLATTMNLFPVGQLDGGHICYALSRRLHRYLSLATIVLLAGIVTYSIVQRGFSVWILWLIILVVMGARHPMLFFEERPLSIGRKLFSFIALLILLLSFMPDPLSIYTD